MASDQSFVDYICEQANLASELSYRKMFGEYALYLRGKVVALICDNQLFVKPTEPGRLLLGKPNDGAPYPGAKPHFRMGDEIDDPEQLRRLLIATAEALPMPKPKPAKRSSRRTKR